MKRRRLLFMLICTATSLGLYGACGFPNLDYSTGSDGASPEASGDSPAPPPGDDGGQDADAGPLSHDASVSDGARLDEASVEAGCCDCDEDHYRNNSGCDAAAWPDSAAKAIDCDDLAPDIHPEKDYTTGTWPPTTPHTPVGDWNCNNNVEYQYNSFNQDCSNTSNCTEGYAGGNPGCGNTGVYNICQMSCVAVLCSCSIKTSFMALPQGCK